jgi:hypothetical protein
MDERFERPSQLIFRRTANRNARQFGFCARAVMRDGVCDRFSNQLLSPAHWLTLEGFRSTICSGGELVQQRFQNPAIGMLSLVVDRRFPQRQEIAVEDVLVRHLACPLSKTLPADEWTSKGANS